MPSTLKRFRFPILLFLLAGLVPVIPAQAQYASGFEATVVDPSGAAVVGAVFEVINQDTQVQQTATADQLGNVRVLHLPPGKYRIEVKAPGFQTWVQENLRVEGNEIRTVYPKLVLGQQSTNIQVTAAIENVETTKGSIGRTLETKTVQEAPLVGETLYASVATLAPGVTGLGDASGSISAAGSLGTNSFNSEAGFQINGAGQRQEANEFQVDGSNVDGNSRDGVVNLSPEPDTVEEMKVSATALSADKGRQSGTLIEVFTKPGTNKFHGTLSEMHTDNALAARTEFQGAGVAIPRYIRNDFGGTIGGPIVKNKTFFFGSLYWMRSLAGQTFTESVETPDFRNYVTTNFPNSMAAKFLQAAPPGSNPTTNFQTVADIESNYSSPFATPDLPSTLAAVGTASISASPINNGFQGHLRIDHNLGGDRDRLFYSMFRNSTRGETADGRPMYSYIDPNATLYNKINYIHTFSPSLINEAGITAFRLTGNQPDKIPSLPNAGINGVDDGFWQWGPSGWTQNNWNFHDVLSYTHSAHTIHVGIDVDRLQDLDDFTNGEDRPYFWFSNILDFAVDHPAYQSGPIVNVKTGGVATNLYQRVLMLYAAPFVQDDWKVSKRLTVNLGLRFDYYGHLSTVENSHSPVAFFTPGSGSTFQEQVTNGSMKVRGSNGQATDDATFRLSPRIGFAWDIFGDGSTSLHGGYGTYTNKVGEYSYVNNMRTNPPDYASPAINIYNSGVTLDNFSYGISSSGAQGFAVPPGLSYTVDANGGLVGTRISVGGIDPHLKAPLVQNWALSLQRIISGFMVEADYFGTKATHLYIQTDVNRFAGDMIVNNGSLAQLNQSFGSITYGRGVGIARTDLAAFAITKHYSKGWTTHAIYTFGKSLDYTSSNDNGVSGAQSILYGDNPNVQYGRSDYDTRHRFSLDAVWDVPSLQHGAGHMITGGWTLSPIVILQSGQPFSVYTSGAYPDGDYNADGFGYDFPDTPSFGNHIKANRSDFLRGVFKASDFSAPTVAGAEGNLGRNTYDGPGYANVNLSVQRSFSIKKLGEGAKLELRGEFINLFNRVNLTNPTNDLTDINFGKSLGQRYPRQVQVVAHIRF